MQRKGLIARYLVILLHTANTQKNKISDMTLTQVSYTSDIETPSIPCIDKKNNHISNHCATWLKDDLSVFVRLNKQGGARRTAEGSAQGCGWVAVSTAQYIVWVFRYVSAPRWCVAVRCPPAWARQTSSAQLPARPEPGFIHVTVFSQHKQLCITHQLAPTVNLVHSTWTLQVSHNQPDKYQWNALKHCFFKRISCANLVQLHQLIGHKQTFVLFCCLDYVAQSLSG